MKPYIYLFIHSFIYLSVEACVNEWLTPRTLDLEVGGSSKEQDRRQGTLLHFRAVVKGWGPGISSGFHEYNPRLLP